MPNASNISCKGKWLFNYTKMDSTTFAIIKPTQEKKSRLSIAKQFNKQHEMLGRKIGKNYAFNTCTCEINKKW